MSSENFEFHYELDGFSLPDQEKILFWLNSVCKEEQKVVKKINYIFCSDAYLLDLNIKYLDHDYYTDILSFPLKNDPIEGDIFISIERVKENAGSYQIPFLEELLRVLVHGLLHFIGYDDHKEEDIEIMRQKENSYISLFLDH